MTHSRAQIIATIGPASEHRDVLRAMLAHQVDAVRYNFSWGTLDGRTKQFELTREIEKELGKHIPIIVDLPGPRVQEVVGHRYKHDAVSAITERDEECIRFAVKHNVDYVAVSFVSKPHDIERCREIITALGGKQKIIAKIERAIALESLDQILAAADAVMVARGDLGNEVPLEQIPFVQERIIKTAKQLGKPVIIATQMLLSMAENPTPTRAEVTDVTTAILEGADAVMLSEETSVGKYPVEAVTMMEKIVLEAEAHMGESARINPL
ncbi:MAG: pyruvate kinase [Patescibacteria group bacterium]